MGNPAVDKLMDRRFVVGTRVTNCIVHEGRKIDARPDDCRLCLDDLRNHFNLALRMNEFLNAWKDEAVKILGGL